MQALRVIEIQTSESMQRRTSSLYICTSSWRGNSLDYHSTAVTPTEEFRRKYIQAQKAHLCQQVQHHCLFVSVPFLEVICLQMAYFEFWSIGNLSRISISDPF